MNIPLVFTPLQSLFEQESSTPPRKVVLQAVYEDFKMRDLVGVPENHLEVTFSPESDSDIIVRKVDPRNASGYQTYRSEEDYFDQLRADLFAPEILEGRLREES